MIPEKNKEYDCFDDGKIRESRRYRVTVTDIIPFDSIDPETRQWWEREKHDCYWLYRETTDYFVKALNGDGEEEVFVRTKKDEWFGMGFLTSGLLDVDGSVMAKLIEWQKDWDSFDKQ